MTTELYFLLATTVLLTLLWIPFVVSIVKSGGELTPTTYRTLELPGEMPHWANRANRAHQNLVEQFGAFAAVILIAHVAGVSTWITVIASAVYFFARVLHAVVMLGGYSMFKARTRSFFTAMLSILAMVIEIVRASL